MQRHMSDILKKRHRALGDPVPRTLSRSKRTQGILMETPICQCDIMETSNEIGIKRML